MSVVVLWKAIKYVFHLILRKRKLVMNMNLFGEDVVIGDFRLSDYGLMLASFDSESSNEEEELGMDHETIEEYIGHNPVPIYLGAKYQNKLKPQITIIKDVEIHSDMHFTEHECREVLRQLTGYKGYKSMQIRTFNFDELIYFNVRIIKVFYKKVASKVIGIIIQLECDSQFAWSKEFNISYNVKSGEIFRIYNRSDDLYNYLYPKVTISSLSSIQNLEIKNISDDNWISAILNISNGEIITMDSKNEILQSSNKDRVIMNDFNMHFIRLVSGENKMQANCDISITFNFRVPRKVGFICE